MDGRRRFLSAFLAAAVANGVLLTFFWPVTQLRTYRFGLEDPNALWHASYVSLWTLESFQLNTGGFSLAAGVSLFVGLGIWILYPRFRRPQTSTP